MNTELRKQLEDDLIHNRLKALVATSALGMGFVKPDISFVILYQAPGNLRLNLESYLVDRLI